MTGHTATVRAVVCAELDNRPIAISGAEDATVRIWDLAERRQVDVFDLPTAAGSVAVSSLGEVVLGLDWDVVVLT